MSVKVSLFAELERVLDSKNMLLVAIKHGQVTVDGYVIGLGDDWRWTLGQLAGRMAKVNHREARLFGASQSRRTTTTSTVTE